MKYPSNFLYIILAVILFNIISTSKVKKWVMWFEKIKLNIYIVEPL